MATAAIFGAWWDPKTARRRGARRSRRFFFVDRVGPCRTCTRTGPRSTVTAFHLASPCPSARSSQPPLPHRLTSPPSSFSSFSLIPFASRSFPSLLFCLSQRFFSSPVVSSLFISFLFLCPSSQFLQFLARDNCWNCYFDFN